MKTPLLSLIRKKENKITELSHEIMVNTYGGKEFQPMEEAFLYFGGFFLILGACTHFATRELVHENKGLKQEVRLLKQEVKLSIKKINYYITFIERPLPVKDQDPKELIEMKAQLFKDRNACNFNTHDFPGSSRILNAPKRKKAQMPSELNVLKAQLFGNRKSKQGSNTGFDKDPGPTTFWR